MKFKLFIAILYMLHNVSLLSSQSDFSGDGGCALHNDFLEQSDDEQVEENNLEQQEDLEDYHNYLQENFHNRAHALFQANKKEVVISSSLIRQLNQVFTHDGYHYQNIEYDAFYKKYRSIADNFIVMAHDQSQLDEFEKFAEEPSYQIVGEFPEFDDEPLFDHQKARDILIDFVNAFIDKHKQDVCSQCLGHTLQINKSTAVLAISCCGIQLHKDCFAQCHKADVAKCLNSHCAQPDWTPEFYAAVLKKIDKVRLKDIYDSDCPVCMEPLKSNNRKRKVKDNTTELSVDGRTPILPSKKAQPLYFR